MVIEYNVTNTNKDKVAILIEPRINNAGFRYHVDIRVKPFRKKKDFRPLCDMTDNYSYRILPYGSFENGSFEREARRKEEVLKWISEEQLREALAYAYSQLKPTENNLAYGFYGF